MKLAHYTGLDHQNFDLVKPTTNLTCLASSLLKHVERNSPSISKIFRYYISIVVFPGPVKSSLSTICSCVDRRLLGSVAAMGVMRKESVILNLAQLGAPKVPAFVLIESPYDHICKNGSPRILHMASFLIKVLLGIILLLSWTEGVNINDMQFTMVEYFSGKGNVSQMFKRSPHHKVATFELKDSKSMDMNSSAGFAFLTIYNMIFAFCNTSDLY